MSSAEPSDPPAEDSFIWRLEKKDLGGSASLVLGDQFSDQSDAALTFFMHRLGESLIKIGTQFLQSRVGDDEDDEDDFYDD